MREMQNHPRTRQGMDQDERLRASNRRPGQGERDLQEVRTSADSADSPVTQIPAYMRYTPEQEAAFKIQDDVIANGGIPTGVSLTEEQKESLNQAIADGTFVGWL
jgi:hypothetical protein